MEDPSIPASSVNAQSRRGILILGVLATAGYGALAIGGDWTHAGAWYALAHGALALTGLAAYRLAAAEETRAIQMALLFAVCFRLVAALGPPALSDDIYRYVWDGRLLARGIHPYRAAPDDPSLAAYRDEVWAAVNHPEIPTIYPPLAEYVFGALAGLGLGVTGFKLAFGAADVAVALALLRLLGRLGVPRRRVILYAWNPLAVMETAGSGHVEPVGTVLCVLAALWVAGPATWRSAAALAAAVQAKLLPLAVLPDALRRWRWRDLAVFAAVTACLVLPLAWTGPAVGEGLFAYAGRWEHNAPVFPLVRGAYEALDLTPALKEGVHTLQQHAPGADKLWAWAYRHVWPGSLARLTVLLFFLAWAVRVAWARALEPARAWLWLLGGVLLLSPTLHPWYLLWVLPFAAALRAWGWLGFSVTVALAYVAGEGDVPGGIRVLEVAPLVLAALAGWIRRTRRKSVW